MIPDEAPSVEGTSCMDDHRRSLNAVGTALIALGVLDIAWSVYDIIARDSYSFGFNFLVGKEFHFPVLEGPEGDRFAVGG